MFFFADNPKLNLPVPPRLGKISFNNSGTFFANNSNPNIKNILIQINLGSLVVRPRLSIKIESVLLNCIMILLDNATTKYINISLKNKSKYVLAHCFSHF